MRYCPVSIRDSESYPTLLSANCAVFKDVRCSLRCPPGRQPQMVMWTSDRLKIAARQQAMRRLLVVPKERGRITNLFCELLLWSCIFCRLAIPVQAQEAGQGPASLHHHHPPQDQLLHDKFYSVWRMPDNPSVSCCNDADCYPTEIKYINGNIYAKRREDGRYIPVPPQKVDRNRDSPDGRNHLCAPPPGVGFHPSDTVYCFALGGAT